MYSIRSHIIVRRYLRRKEKNIRSRRAGIMDLIGKLWTDDLISPVKLAFPPLYDAYKSFKRMQGAFQAFQKGKTKASFIKFFQEYNSSLSGVKSVSDDKDIKEFMQSVVSFLSSSCDEMGKFLEGMDEDKDLAKFSSLAGKFSGQVEGKLKDLKDLSSKLKIDVNGKDPKSKDIKSLFILLNSFKEICDKLVVEAVEKSSAKSEE